MARLNINGRIISVISYDETYTDDDGNDQLYIPSGKCILTAPAAGRTCYGAVSQVEQADGEFHTLRRPPRAEICVQRRGQHPHADHLQPPAADP